MFRNPAQINLYAVLFQGGGGRSVLLTSNGAKLNGFASKHNGIVNGHIPNGHVTSFLQHRYNEEHLDGVKEEVCFFIIYAPTKDLSLPPWSSG